MNILVPRHAGGRFADSSCLVTGAGGGIGLAVARALVAEGGNVVVMARSIDECEAAAASLGSAGAAAPGDVTDPAACERAVEMAAARFGPVETLIHAAGISP